MFHFGRSPVHARVNRSISSWQKGISLRHILFATLAIVSLRIIEFLFLFRWWPKGSFIVWLTVAVIITSTSLLVRNLWLRNGYRFWRTAIAGISAAAVVTAMTWSFSYVYVVHINTNFAQKFAEQVRYRLKTEGMKQSEINEITKVIEIKFEPALMLLGDLISILLPGAITSVFVAGLMWRSSGRRKTKRNYSAPKANPSCPPLT